MLPIKKKIIIIIIIQLKTDFPREIMEIRLLNDRLKGETKYLVSFHFVHRENIFQKEIWHFQTIINKIYQQTSQTKENVN